MKKSRFARKGSFWQVSDLGSFYVENRTTLVAYAMRITGDRQRAEDVVQESFMKFILASPQLESREHALVYLKRIIQNLSIDMFRSENRRPNLIVVDEAVENSLALSVVNSDQVIQEAEDASIVRQALSLLSPAERSALLMWELEGRSAKEIAQALGIKETSVRHTVSRARASMRRVLSEFIIDEARGLTALDLLSSTYKRSAELAKKSSRAALSLFLLVFAYLGFTNLIDSPSLELTTSTASKVEVSTSEIGNSFIATKTESEKVTPSSFSKNSRISSAAAKAAPINFAGLDKFGVPTGFTVTDSTGLLGTLYFNGKEILNSESGMSVQSIAKTASGAANIFLNQTISQDSTGTSYEAILAYGRNGAWVPLNSRVISSENERLVSGNYMLTVVIQVKSEVESTIVIPASNNGRDLEVQPSRVVTRILLNSSKTQILAQAVQVVEKVSRT